MSFLNSNSVIALIVARVWEEKVNEDECGKLYGKSVLSFQIIGFKLTPHHEVMSSSFPRIILF